MKWPFKLWSEVKTQAKTNIDPKLGLRSWDKLESSEKKKIWLHFNHERYFIFDRKESDYPYNLINKKDYLAILITIMSLKENYKKQDLANNFLESEKMGACYEDFKAIFFNEKTDAVLEMLSIYAKYLFDSRKDETIRQNENESEGEYDKRLLEWRLAPLELFKRVFNDIFEHFELNYRLTKGGIIPYQPKIIIEEIYNPTFQALCEKSFDKVNRDIEDAISQFRKKEPNSYSTCITLCIGALEEFLKVMILKESDKVDAQVLSKLIGEAMRKEAVPADFFTKQIFSNLESIFMKERKETGQAHSKDDYATEKNAKLMLNLTLVFIQHCMESN